MMRTRLWLKGTRDSKNAGVSVGRPSDERLREEQTARGFSDWVTHFHNNRTVHEHSDPLIGFDSVCDLSTSLRNTLIRSVQRFQLGESGEGSQLLRKAELAGDPDYFHAAKLFVAEEQQHAALLLLLLTYL